MKDIAIVIGHTIDSKGACSPFGVPCEWDFNSKVASYLTDIADIFTYSNYKSGYTTMVKRNADKINKGNYKLVIELHYNSAVDSSANGCKTLYYFKNKVGKYLAEQSSKIISQDMGVKDRGITALVNENDRGFAAVYYPNPTTILLEPFFGSNNLDTSKFIGNEEKYSKSIRKIINLVK